MQLEICAFSSDAAINAAKSGADRIELCCGASEGGTTPNYALIKKVCELVSIPVFPIIRPRGGDFLYNNDEFEIMKHDILICKKLGCSGVTFSILLADNRVDYERTAKLVESAYPMEVTFIRGFDITPDPFEALETIRKTGCKRILTSGQAGRAIDAVALLKQLVAKAGDDISIMPGSGINSANIESIISETGAKEFHASARYIIDNENTLVDKFGFGQNIDCNIDEVKEIKRIMNLSSSKILK